MMNHSNEPTEKAYQIRRYIERFIYPKNRIFILHRAVGTHLTQGEFGGLLDPFLSKTEPFRVLRLLRAHDAGGRTASPPAFFLARGHEAQARSWCSAGRRKKHEGAGGEDREKREAKQVSREKNNWSVRGAEEGEEESEEESNTEDSLGISVGERKKSSGGMEEIEAVVV